MEFQKEKQTRQREIEFFTMLIFSVYDIYMIFRLFARGHAYFLGALLLLLLVVAWGMFAKQFQAFELRTLHTTILMEVSLLAYAFVFHNSESVIRMFILFSLAISFYGARHYVYLSMVSAMLFFFMILISNHIVPQEGFDIQRLIGQMIFIMGFELILLAWVTGYNAYERKEWAERSILNRKLQEQYTLIGTIGSEIQKPLSLIEQTAVSMRCGDVTQETQNQLDNVVGICSYLNGRAMDVSDYGKLQLDQLSIQENAYDVTEMVNGFIQSAMVLHHMTGVEFILDFDSRIPKMLIGDGDIVNRIVLQILGNAFQFTKEGFVKMTIGGRRESYGYNLMITLRDTGIGLNGEEIWQILSKQLTIPGQNPKPNQGTGMGLYMTKMLIEKMGGTIKLCSRENRGTEIQIVLPQKIKEEITCITIPKNKKVNALIYLNMGQFEREDVRETYMDVISHIVSLLPMEYQICRNLSELKRRAEGENYTHVIITDSAYHEEEEFFDLISLSTKLVVLMDRDEETIIDNPRPYYVYKPFHILSIADVLWENGTHNTQTKEHQAERTYRHAKTEAAKQETVAKDSLVEEDRIQSQMNKVAQQTVITKEDQEGLVIGDLDIKTAVLYCGGEDCFLKILAKFIIHSDETRQELVDLYETKDWKNYVIKVHGLKSSMLSLGAKTLSEQAKELEYAGKAERYDLIETKMPNLLEEYDRVISMVSSCPVVAREIAVQRQSMANARQEEATPKEQAETQKEEITSESFGDYLQQMEAFSYELNQDEMVRILDQLCEYQYKGNDLKTELSKIREKIMHQDFFSAADTLRAMKEKMDEKEGM